MKFCACITIPFILFLPNVKAQEAQFIQNKSGGKMEIVSAVAEGEFLLITLKQGQMKLPKSALGPESLAKYFPGASPIASQSPSPERQSARRENTEGVSGSSPIPPGDASPNKPVAAIAIPETLPDSLPALPPTAEAQIFSAEKVAFEIESTIPGNKRVKIQALVPKDKTGKIPDSASNIVFYAPHIGDNNLHEKRTAHDQRIFWELCENFGMTVFTAEFNTSLADVDDRKKCYYYPESGSAKVVFDAREKLIRDNRFRKTKMFVIGNSGGSSLAERIGLLYSNDIAAVAMMGGGRFDPVQSSVNIPWLILNTRGDSRAPQNVELVQQLRAHGMNALYAETEPWATKREDIFLKQNDDNFHHTSSDLGFDLIKKYIVDVVAQQGDSIPRPLKPALWPLSSSTSAPFLVNPTSSEIGKRNPFEERLFFPSQDFAKLWQTVPYRTFPIGPTKGENGMSVSAIVRYPPVDVLSKGIVVFNSGNNDDEALSSDYLDYIAMRGYIAVTCPFSNSENKMLADSKSLLRATLTVFSESHLPMYLAGVKSGGRHMMLAGSDCDSARVRGILAVDAELDWPFPELSPMKKLPNSKIASFLLVSSMESPEMKMQMKAFMEIADCHNKTVTCSVVEKNVTTPELDGIDLCLDLLEKQKIKE